MYRMYPEGHEKSGYITTHEGHVVAEAVRELPAYADRRTVKEACAEAVAVDPERVYVRTDSDLDYWLVCWA